MVKWVNSCFKNLQTLKEKFRYEFVKKEIVKTPGVKSMCAYSTQRILTHTALVGEKQSNYFTVKEAFLKNWFTLELDLS